MLESRINVLEGHSLWTTRNGHKKYWSPQSHIFDGMKRYLKKVDIDADYCEDRPGRQHQVERDCDKES